MTTQTLSQRAFLGLQYALPHHLVSRVVRVFTRVRFAPFKNLLIRWATRHYGIDTEAASRGGDPAAYRSFNDFFTRELKPGARPLADAPWVCPADGVVSQAGAVEDQRILQAKGHDYSVAALLGADDAIASRLGNGTFVTVYLSPRDYHRVHMPAAGELVEQRDIDGRLFSVAPLTVENIPGLFARNARRVSIFRAASDRLFAVVLVGAINVSSMDTVWDHGEHPTQIDRGDEMGRFNLGSTVIVVTEERIDWGSHIVAGQEVSMGQALL